MEEALCLQQKTELPGGAGNRGIGKSGNGKSGNGKSGDPVIGTSDDRKQSQ
jgi:hypothetical protein